MKNILIISASAGSGHTMAARALEQWLEKAQKYPGEFRVAHIDFLQFATLLYRKVYRDVYLYLAAKQPLLYGYIYTTSDRLKRENKPDFLMRFMNNLNALKFAAYIQETPWDVIVSTHFLASQLLARFKDQHKVFCPLISVVTDYGLHSWWITPGCDHFITADAACKNHLAAMGIPEGAIHDFGIPVRPAFARRPAQPGLKKSLGLDPDLPAILLLSGGFGVGPIEHIVADLARLKGRFQLAAVAGQNRKMLARLQQMAPKLPYQLQPVGFTDEIDRYMRASELVVTKPGGLTTAECLALGKPMLIINPIPGQEDMNSDMLLEHGAAVKAMQPVDVTYKLGLVLNTPGRLARMKQAARQLGRPGAGREAAGFIARLAREQAI